MPSFIRIRDKTNMEVLIGTHAISSVIPEYIHGDGDRPGMHARVALVNGNFIQVVQTLDQIQAALINTEDCTVGKP